MGDKFERDLERGPANWRPLSPLDFLAWSAAVYPDKTAVVHGASRRTYRQFRERCVRLASALGRAGVRAGDTVAVMAPNVPALLEAHYGVPMAGAVLNALNIRLDAATVAFILEHGEAEVLIADREFAGVIKDALAKTKVRPLVVEVDDPLGPAEAGHFGSVEYESFLAGGDPGFAWKLPDDEWRAIALNYTSGTTGNPKGVVYHHRGAYLNALGNVMAFGLDRRAVYLWTLPMFHCNGWCYTWAVTAAAGTHVCLRKVDPVPIFRLIRDEGVTHMCGAPIVLNMLIHAPDGAKTEFFRRVKVATGGAAPPSSVIAAMEAMGFDVTHLYGLTETFGPSALCAWHDEWTALDLDARASLAARQGVVYPTLGDLAVADPASGTMLPADGHSLGEVVVRGHTVMKGYLKNPKATAEAFRGGWFRTGDLGVMHPDGYMEIKDRAKDIIISGGENISSLEIEEALYRHSAVMEAAVVAKPDSKWGETPCAFVALKAGASATAEDIVRHCRDRLAHFKAPRHVVFGPLPKTATGKIQKYVLRERAKEI
jgi:fatty-acyl-CoA synthase